MIFGPDHCASPHSATVRSSSTTSEPSRASGGAELTSARPRRRRHYREAGPLLRQRYAMESAAGSLARQRVQASWQVGWMNVRCPGERPLIPSPWRQIALRLAEGIGVVAVAYVMSLQKGHFRPAPDGRSPSLQRRSSAVRSDE